MRLMTSNNRGLALAFCAAACFVFPGCGAKEELPELVPVTGTVMFDGKPLPNAVITFFPTDTSEEEGMVTIVRPTAKTDDQGAFELVWNENAGAPPGEYKVTIMAFKPNDDDEVKPESLIPEKYNNPKTSGLTKTINSEGDNVLEFNL